jgi:hypothetical protein
MKSHHRLRESVNRFCKGKIFDSGTNFWLIATIRRTRVGYFHVSKKMHISISDGYISNLKKRLIQPFLSCSMGVKRC